MKPRMTPIGATGAAPEPFFCPNFSVLNSLHLSRPVVTVVVLVAEGLLLLGASSARAQDRVILQRKNYSARITVSGVIEDYTGSEISIRTDSDQEAKKYPSADVVEIETSQTEPHTRGLQLFAEGQVEKAIGELETAVKKEPRTWVRREILAALVRCGLRRADYTMAGVRFLALLKSDATTRHFRLIPLVWAPEMISREARLEARSWMNGTVEAGRLLGASLLYDDPESGTEARKVLKELSSSADPRVRVFAQMQAWREEALAGNPGKLLVAKWQQRIDEMPEDFRAGPLFLLGRAYAARHDYELAAATLLWIPLVDDHDSRLAARACLEAGTALDRIGQHAEARTLFREVTTRFADTPFAEEAGALLKRAADSTDAPPGREAK